MLVAVQSEGKHGGRLLGQVGHPAEELGAGRRSEQGQLVELADRRRGRQLPGGRRRLVVQPEGRWLGPIAELPHWADKYGVRYTPTFQFFPDTLGGLAAKAPEAREVARAPGYLNPDDFLTLFRFVREKAYETKSFRDYVKAARG